MDAYPLMLMVMVISFLLLLMSGFPIAFVLGGVGLLSGLFGWFLYEQGAYNYAPSLNEAKLSGMVDGVWSLVSNDVLVAIPLFIFMGLMLDKSGMAERMMQSMQLLFGRLRGGLALTVVLIGIILAASTGIVGASVVLLGLLAMPAMLQQGYAKP